MKRPITRWVVVATALCAIGWAAYQGTAQSAEARMASLMPQGAVLFLEAKDLSSLLQEWNASPVKKAWLQSDNYDVFSRSRLWLRLERVQREFEAAAGLPPDMNFLGQIVGQHSALAMYDIGKLEMLYITRQPSARAMQSALWQQRSKFEPREVAGQHFFVRTEPESGRVFAFAVLDDYLVLATREDLAAGALSLLAKRKLATLDDESWFTKAIKSAKEPGDLRMVINLAKLTHTPQFRTYWVQQNNTEMQQYDISVSDLYRDAAEYREERVLFRKSDDSSSKSGDDRHVAEIARLVPPNTGFYRASLTNSEAALTALEQKVLTPHVGPAPAQKVAPSVALGEGTVGSESKLDVRIDVAPTPTAAENGDEALKAELAKYDVRAMLEMHRSEPAADGVFVKLRSTLVLSAAKDWNDESVRSAIQQLIAPGLTAGAPGVGWKQIGNGVQSYFELNGLEPIAVATRGKYLAVSNDPATLLAVLGRAQNAEKADPLIFVAGFDHAHERQNFYKLTALVDRPNRISSSGMGPEFFSQNVQSLSEVFAGVESMSVTATRNGTVERQTVRYHWAR